MDLHQLQVSFQPEHDRLLFRASFRSDDGGLQEVRAWLTRRMLRVLWPGIVNALQTQVALDKPQAAHASSHIVGMEHHASVDTIRGNGNFNTPFENNVQVYPLGEEPFLVSVINFNLDAGKPIRINMAPAKGYGVEIALPPQVLHGFCVLLKEAAGKAEWDLNLTMPGQQQSGPPAGVLN